MYEFRSRCVVVCHIHQLICKGLLLSFLLLDEISLLRLNWFKYWLGDISDIGFALCSLAFPLDWLMQGLRP